MQAAVIFMGCRTSAYAKVLLPSLLLARRFNSSKYLLNGKTSLSTAAVCNNGNSLTQRRSLSGGSNRKCSRARSANNAAHATWARQRNPPLTGKRTAIIGGGQHWGPAGWFVNACHSIETVRRVAHLLYSAATRAFMQPLSRRRIGISQLVGWLREERGHPTVGCAG